MFVGSIVSYHFPANRVDQKILYYCKIRTHNYSFLQIQNSSLFVCLFNLRQKFLIARKQEVHSSVCISLGHSSYNPYSTLYVLLDFLCKTEIYLSYPLQWLLLYIYFLLLLKPQIFSSNVSLPVHYLISLIYRALLASSEKTFLLLLNIVFLLSDTEYIGLLKWFNFFCISVLE